MTPKEFREECELGYNHFQELTSTGIKPNYDNIERFAEEYHQAKLKLLGIVDVVGRSEQLSCGRNITTCVFYKDGGKCSNHEYCIDQTT